MPDIPTNGMSKETPFMFFGVDMFIPFVVKNGHKEMKRYMPLYTCLSSKSIYIEVTYSLSIDSFIMCLRRFIGRRENVSLIRSDNGSNFFGGASIVLIQAFQEMDHSRISNYLKQHDGEWINSKRNLPFTSNMGGVWDQQICSARMILSSLLTTYGGSLADDSLQTLLVEVETIVSSLPLTTETINDVTSLIPLSPTNILRMKSKIVMPPPGVFVSPDKYCRKDRRKVQHI